MQVPTSENPLCAACQGESQQSYREGKNSGGNELFVPFQKRDRQEINVSLYHLDRPSNISPRSVMRCVGANTLFWVFTLKPSQLVWESRVCVCSLATCRELSMELLMLRPACLGSSRAAPAAVVSVCRASSRPKGRQGTGICMPRLRKQRGETVCLLRKRQCDKMSL